MWNYLPCTLLEEVKNTRPMLILRPVNHILTKRKHLFCFLAILSKVNRSVALRKVNLTNTWSLISAPWWMEVKLYFIEACQDSFSTNVFNSTQRNNRVTNRTIKRTRSEKKPLLLFLPADKRRQWTEHKIYSEISKWFIVEFIINYDLGNWKKNWISIPYLNESQFTHGAIKYFLVHNLK